MLGIDRSSTGRTVQKAKSGRLKKKPKNMSREVFALVGAEGLPSLVPTDKERRGAKRIGSKVQWRQTALQSSARSDNLKLFHWQRVDVEFPDYPFARFNKNAQMLPLYTDQEYNSYIKNLDPLWSRAATDYLFKLCKRFDLRWLVVADRYSRENLENEASHTVEDMKDRFYSIQRALCHCRDMIDQASEYEYDALHERRRKTQLNVAFTRTRAVDIEEARLKVELKQINTQLRQLQRGNKSKSKSKHKVGNTGTVSVKSELKRTTHSSNQSGLDMTKNMDTDPADPDFSEPKCGNAVKQPDQPPSYTKEKNYLRSTRLNLAACQLGPGPRMLRKVELVLAELGISSRPMPTQVVCDMYDKLRQDIIKVLTLQKHYALRMTTERASTQIEFEPGYDLQNSNAEHGNIYKNTGPSHASINSNVSQNRSSTVDTPQSSVNTNSRPSSRLAQKRKVSQTNKAAINHKRRRK